MRSYLIITGLILSFLIGGCATNAGTGTALGAGGGAAIGGILGGGTGALVGAVAGGVLGYGIGRNMDEQDRQRAAAALEANRTAEWQDSQGNSYRVVPGSTTTQGGRECRNYRMYANVGGQADTVHGVACRNPDGSWQNVSG